MLLLLLLAAVINLSLLFLCISWVLVLIHQRNPQCWRVLFFLLFLTHIVGLCHLLGVRPCEQSSVPLFIGTSVCILSLSLLRMVLGILQRKLPRCLLIWWGFYSRAWFWKVFLFIGGTLSLSYFISVWWCPLPIFSTTCKFPFLQVICIIIIIIIIWIVVFGENNSVERRSYYYFRRSELFYLQYLQGC